MPEIFRYRRDGVLRVYEFRVVQGGTELWRVTVRAGEPAAEIKEDDFTDPDVAARFCEEIHRALTAGGWREEPRQAGRSR